MDKVQKVAAALAEVKRTGSALVLCCLQPQHVPDALDFYGADFLVERRGDYEISATVELEAGWWTSTAEIWYQWDGRRTDVGIRTRTAPPGV